MYGIVYTNNKHIHIKATRPGPETGEDGLRCAAGEAARRLAESGSRAATKIALRRVPLVGSAFVILASGRRQSSSQSWRFGIPGVRTRVHGVHSTHACVCYQNRAFFPVGKEEQPMTKTSNNSLIVYAGVLSRVPE